jgi:inner membrane protein involved in colicin E2 resistance
MVVWRKPEFTGDYIPLKRNMQERGFQRGSWNGRIT